MFVFFYFFPGLACCFLVSKIDTTTVEELELGWHRHAAEKEAEKNRKKCRGKGLLFP